MNSKLNSILIIFLFAFLSCKDSEPTAPPITQINELAITTIGPSGGLLSSDEFILSVPQGAFDESTELKLYAIPNENPFAENKNSNFFKVEGIPIEYSKPLEIRIKYADTTSGEHFIGIGMDSYSRTAGSERTSYFIDAAADSGNFLTYTIQPSASTSFSKVSGPESTGYVTMFIMAIARYNTYWSPNGHFAIYYGNKVNPNQIGKLGGYLETAYETFKNMGFSYSSRIIWPIHVTVKDLNADGYFNFSRLGDNFANLEIDALVAIDIDATLRTVASHEFFHMIQYFYYPYTGLSALNNETYTWLDEATATWSEELFTDQQNYNPDAREKDNRRMAPFIGAQFGQSPDAQAHGYGMSCLIKYLVDKNTSNCLVKFYDQVNNEEAPIDCIKLSTSDPVTWWEDFLTDYVLGNIYTDVNLNYWMNNVHDSFTIASEADTLKKFNDAYPDLSGRLYDIKLNYPNIDPNAKLQCEIDGGLTSVVVFKYKGTTIEKIAGPSASTEVSNIKNLQDDGYNLLILSANSRAVSPYTNTTDLELTVKIAKPGALDIYNYTKCMVKVKWRGMYRQGSGNPVQFEPSRFYEGSGSWNNNTYTGVDDDGQYRDSIKITIDPNTLTVTNYEAYWSTHFDHSSESVKGGNLTLVKDGVMYKGEVLGVNACNYISDLTDVSDSDNPWVLVSYDCSDNSYVKIEFEK